MADKTKVISALLLICMKYKNYLENVLGYTGTTTNIYTKYALELEVAGLDYIELMNVYKDSSNNTKRLILSAVKRYYSYIGDSRKNEIILPKKDIKFQEYVNFD